VFNPFRVVLASIIAIPITLWLYSVGNPTDYLDAHVPRGQLLYILSKLAGLIGLSLIALQIVLVYTRNHPWFRFIGWTRVMHRALGISLFAMVSLHVGLFIAAASLRSGKLALGPLSLRFNQGFYDQMVSLGAIAYFLLLVVVTAGVFIDKYRQYYSLHRIHGIIVLVLTCIATVHSFSIGSETKSVPMFIFYALLSLIVACGIFKAVKTRAKP